MEKVYEAEINKLMVVINEATRFIACANTLKAKLKENGNYQLKERAAAKRASMDLTRELASFRQWKSRE